MNQLNFLMKDISTWTDKQFGPHRSAKQILNHLIIELNETTNALDENKGYDGFASEYGRWKTLLEYSDLLIILLDSADKAGFSAEELLQAAFEKMEINKLRDLAA